MDNLARALNLLGAAVEPLRCHQAALQALDVWPVPSEAHLVAGRRAVVAQLAPLPPTEQQATYEAALDFLINRDQNNTRYTRQVLCNSGMPPTLNVVEPKSTGADGLLLQRLDAQQRSAAAVAYARWQAAVAAKARGPKNGEASNRGTMNGDTANRGTANDDAVNRGSVNGDTTNRNSVNGDTTNRNSVNGDTTNRGSVNGDASRGGTADAKTANGNTAGGGPANGNVTDDGATTSSGPKYDDEGQLREAAERACRRAFGNADARTLDLLLAALAACVANRDVQAALDKVPLLTASSAHLDCVQADVVLASEGLAILALGETGEVAEREEEAKPWLRLYRWAGVRVRGDDAAAVASRRAAFARLQKKLGRLATDPLSTGAERADRLSDQIDAMVERLRGQGAGAEQMRRRAQAKVTEWTQGSLDNQRAAEMWLEKWLTLASGYPLAELPDTLPAYDRREAASSEGVRLSASEIERRLGLFAQAFDQRIVGNVRLFCALQAYLRGALTHGEQVTVLLHGQAGTGKSGIAEILAETIFPQAHYHSKNISGASSASAILGVSPTYHGSEFSLFAEGLAGRRGRQVFFFVDEVDHTSAAVQDALATALDFNDRAPFQDGYLQVPLRLHGDPMVFACNDLGGLQKQLISRFRKGLVAETQVLDAHDRREVIWRQFVRTLAGYDVSIQVGGRPVGALPYAQTHNVFDPSFFARLDADHPEIEGLRPLLSTVQKIGHMSRLAPQREAWAFPLAARHVALTAYKNWLTPSWLKPVVQEGRTYYFFKFEVGLFCDDVSRSDWRDSFSFVDPQLQGLRYKVDIERAKVSCSVEADEGVPHGSVSFYGADVTSPAPQSWADDFNRNANAQAVVFASDADSFFAEQSVAAPVVLLAKQRLFIFQGKGVRQTA